eukprot:2454592-Rhodomonas_salina.1
MESDMYAARLMLPSDLVVVNNAGCVRQLTTLVLRSSFGTCSLETLPMSHSRWLPLCSSPVSARFNRPSLTARVPTPMTKIIFQPRGRLGDAVAASQPSILKREPLILQARGLDAAACPVPLAVVHIQLLSRRDGPQRHCQRPPFLCTRDHVPFNRDLTLRPPHTTKNGPDRTGIACDSPTRVQQHAGTHLLPACLCVSVSLCPCVSASASGSFSLPSVSLIPALSLSPFLPSHRSASPWSLPLTLASPTGPCLSALRCRT